MIVKIVIISIVCIALTASIVNAEEAVNPILGKPVARLEKVLKSDAPELNRLNAAKALMGLAPQKQAKVKRGQEVPKREVNPINPELLNAFVVGLNDSACSVRSICRQGLVACQLNSVPALIAALTHKNDYVRMYAAYALTDIARAEFRDNMSSTLPLSDAVPALTKMLDDKNYAVREAATVALWHFRTAAAPALDKLIKLLNDDEFSVADAAVHAVAAADPSGEKSVPALAKVLKQSKHELREIVCNELGAMGQKAHKAFPELIKLVNVDRDSWYAGKAACGALIKIVTYQAKDAAGNPTTDLAAEVRPQAIGAIVQSALNHKAEFCRNDRFTSLYIKSNLVCPMGPEALPLLPKTLDMLKEWMPRKKSKYMPRSELCTLIVRIGRQDTSKVLPLIKELIADKTTDPGGLKQLQQMLKDLEG